MFWIGTAVEGFDSMAVNREHHTNVILIGSSWESSAKVAKIARIIQNSQKIRNWSK